MNYFLLILFWIIYYAVHSILASTTVKDFFRKKSGKHFRYYRLAYSFFATITLIFLLFFQYSFYSPELIKSVFLKYFSALFLVLPGLVIMFISIKKYFMLLSGVRSLFVATPPSELKINGIHRFVRHPLYLGTILFVCGLFFLFPTISNLIAVVLLIGYVLIGITFEEKKLIREFGKNYEEYISKVPMLIPHFNQEKD
jgi:protein-S-isoprenylcysteine O-methyltransferase Ste14